MFTLKIHHGGQFLNVPKRMYVGDRAITYIDYCEIDRISLLELKSMVTQLGYNSVAEFYHRIPGNEKEEDSVFRQIQTDSDLLKVSDYIPRSREV